MEVSLPGGTPEIMQVINDHDLVVLRIETYGDLEILHFKNPPNVNERRTTRTRVELTVGCDY